MTQQEVGRPPRIDTARLILDGHHAEDLEPLAAMWADPAIVAGLGGRPSSRQESWMRLLRYRGLWPVLGYGYWAIREQGTGRFVGDIGFADFHRELQPSIDGVPEAGWVLAAWAHGRGYATEALDAALRWLDARLDIERCVCLIDPANTASIRLAGRHGFAAGSLILFRDTTTLVLSRPRPAAGSDALSAK